MSAQVESSFTGEGMNDSGDIRSWMTEHNIRLLDDTYAKLAENEFRSIKDLAAVTVDEMSEYVKDMNIKLPDRSKLKRALETLNNKARIYDPDEINAIKSMTLKIKQFENIINKQTNNEEIINKKSEEIQTQINNEFDKIIKKINEQRIYLSKTLNDIKNKKIAMIKTRSNSYNQSLNMVKKMKTETDILMNKAIEISELNDRKLKIIQTEKNMIKIINDIIEKNKIAINCEINATFDTTNLIQFIQKFGIISEGDIVVLERLEYDNNNPNGIINVIWKLNKMDNENKHNDYNNNGKLSIEYGIINDDIKNNNIDEKALKCEEINIGNEINGINNIKISDIGMYLFKLKYFSKEIWSQYSEVKRINVMKILNIPRINSAILNDNEKRKLMDMLNKELNRNDGNIKLNLLYRYSRDDKTSKGFHTMCDNKGATVVIVKSKKYNHVFGAYLSLAWTSNQGWKKDSNLFLFLLRSSFGHDQRVFKLKQRDLPYAVYHYSGYHPYIVCSGAIGIQQGDNKSWSYIDTSYLEVKGNALCGGDSYNETCNKQYFFSVDNYEVFTVKYN